LTCSLLLLLLLLSPLCLQTPQPLSTRAHAVAIAIGLDYLMHGVGTAFKGAMLCKMTTKSFFLAAGSNLFVAVSLDWFHIYMLCKPRSSVTAKSCLFVATCLWQLGWYKRIHLCCHYTFIATQV
jgi:hypothetical protein